MFLRFACDSARARGLWLVYSRVFTIVQDSNV